MQTKQENQLEINNSIGTAGYARTVGEDGKSYRTGISALIEGAIGDDIEQLENDVEALQITVGEHTADIQNNSDDISDLQTLTSGHTTSIGNLQTAVETNTGDITDLKEDLDLKLDKASLFGDTEVINAADSLTWALGYINLNDGSYVNAQYSGNWHIVNTDLVDVPANTAVTCSRKWRYARFNALTDEFIDVSGWQNEGTTRTTLGGYKCRIQVLGETTQSAAEVVKDNVSTYLSIPVTIEHEAEITTEKLTELGMATKEYVDGLLDIATWVAGYIDPNNGALHPNEPYAGNYHAYSSLIKSEYGFSIKTSSRIRWFWYNKTTGEYVSGVNWQNSNLKPVTFSFSSEYDYRIQITGTSTIADTQALIDSIDSYITIEKNNFTFIEFLPITDVYVGDVQQRIYFNELARYNENAGFFVVTANGATYPEVTYTDRYVEFNLVADKNITINIAYYVADMMTASKTLAIHGKISIFSAKKVMFLGDSYTSNGGMVKWFKDHNSNAVTLYGTRTTTIDGVTYSHEGRGGWTAGNYINNDSVGNVSNPFYNPTSQTFDFSYYMENAGSAFTDVDIVNILLGRNSGFPVSNMDNLDMIVASIKAYNSNIMVVLMCDNNLAADNSGAGAYMQNVHIANKQSHIYNKAFYEKYKDSEDVVMCFANLNIDNVYDYESEEVDSSITNPTKVKRYTDNVHPWNIPGLGKLGIALNGLLRNIL